jgi:hypothetical protein
VGKGMNTRNIHIKIIGKQETEEMKLKGLEIRKEKTNIRDKTVKKRRKMKMGFWYKREQQS